MVPDPKVRRYQLLAQLWAAVFAGVGGAFAFAPSLTANFLNWGGRVLGLSGNIVAPSGTIWQILTLSLMATLTFLAWSSGREPKNLAVYQAMLLAKAVSVGGFLILSVTVPVFLICAAADAFVFVTLVVVYPSRSFADR